jgi:far upstream element-binding protein
MSGGGRAAKRPQQHDNSERQGSHQPPLREGEDTMQIMVPDRTVGLIIGRGGETIRDLQERSGCHVNIVGESKSVNGLRPVNLIGTREASAKAKDLIMEIVESDSKSTAEKARGGPVPRDNNRDQGFGQAPQGDKINDSIFVPSEAVGMIIGKGGETIKDMQNTTGCKINVSPSSGPGEVEREIGLVGSRDSIERAKRAIEDKVEAVVSPPIIHYFINYVLTQFQQIKNGTGGRRPPRDNYNNDNSNYGQQSYGAPQQSYGAQQPAQAGAPAPGGEDPYAAYGGYQAYVALWYQAMAAQQQQTQGGAPGGAPPGAPQ